MRVLAFLLFLQACAAHRSGEAVARVQFDGIDRGPWPRSMFTPQSPRALRSAMRQQQGTWISAIFPGISEPAWLNRGALDEDGWRIEIWYANHGYFDARFLGWEIIDRNEEGTERAVRPVRVRGVLEQGEPSKVRDLVFEGMEGIMGPTQRQLRALVTLEKGEIYETDDYTASLEGLRGRLLERSYAHARVEGVVFARAAEHEVDVTFRISPGPSCHFGPVTLEGTHNVPKQIIEDYVTFEEGDSFSPRQLSLTRARLFEFRVFSSVDIIPDLSDPTSPVVPVRIVVREGKARELSVGPGFQWDGSELSGFAQARWSDNNLFYKLWRMHQETRVGAAVFFNAPADVSDLGLVSQWGPLLDVKGEVEIPHVMGPKWSLVNQGRVQIGIEPGYRFFSPEMSPSMTWRIQKELTFSGGIRVRYYDYFDLRVPLEDIEDSPLGVDVRDPFVLALLEQRLTYDGRNDPVQPHRGWYWNVAVAEAGPPGNFQFLRGEADVRTYRSLVELFGWDPDIVIAGRIGGGYIQVWGTGEGANVPFAERLYLGGGTTVRGWGHDRLGPYVETEDVAAAADDEPRDQVLVPVGGMLQLFGNAEVRKGLPLGLSMVGFTDVGRVWDTPANFSFGGLLWSVGGGLRYMSPIGPIRVDVATRLGRPDYFEVVGDVTDRLLFPRVTVHFGLSEMF